MEIKEKACLSVGETRPEVSELVNVALDRNTEASILTGGKSEYKTVKISKCIICVNILG